MALAALRRSKKWTFLQLVVCRHSPNVWRRNAHHRARSWQEWTSPLNIRLLNVDTLKLSDPSRERYNNPLDYAILSHAWREDGDELSFEDLKTLDIRTAANRATFDKIQYTSEQTKRDGLEYFWIDTCCINKSSSAEISEAINSMYQWYSRARVCYVYLADVRAGCEQDIRCSRWFTRAWTLQELLAPRRVEFYDKDWNPVGRLSDPKFANLVSEITGIDVEVLLHRLDHRDVSIAQRMSWAAKRNATREEDRAYSLLGLFDVHMPMLYGEGGRAAFYRLQEQMIQTSTDHSIFCWENPTEQCEGYSAHDNRSLFAPSPSSFMGSEDVAITRDSAPRPYQVTNRGLEITLPIRSYWKGHAGHALTCARLNCVRSGKPDQMIVLNLERQYDLDAEANKFKPWLRSSQRRRREAWDHYMGRHFDWHFVASYARRGFAVGHPASGRRLGEMTPSKKDFREQTVVLLRVPGPPYSSKSSRRTANPLSTFNELQFAMFGMYLSVTVGIILAYRKWAEDKQEDLPPEHWDPYRASLSNAPALPSEQF